MKDISIIWKKTHTISSIFAEMRVSIFTFFTVVRSFYVRDSSSPWYDIYGLVFLMFQKSWNWKIYFLIKSVSAFLTYPVISRWLMWVRKVIYFAKVCFLGRVMSHFLAFESFWVFVIFSNSVLLYLLSHY